MYDCHPILTGHGQQLEGHPEDEYHRDSEQELGEHAEEAGGAGEDRSKDPTASVTTGHANHESERDRHAQSQEEGKGGQLQRSG